MQYRLRCSVVAFFGFILVAALSYWYFRNGIDLRVVNGLPVAVSDVSISFRDGSAFVGKIESGKVQKVFLRPGGEAGLSISFRSVEDNVLREIEIKDYFERGFRGTAEIVIGADGIASRIVERKMILYLN